MFRKLKANAMNQKVGLTMHSPKLMVPHKMEAYLETKYCDESQKGSAHTEAFQYVSFLYDRSHQEQYCNEINNICEIHRPICNIRYGSPHQYFLLASLDLAYCSCLDIILS
jgi:hypothetical protein